MNRLTPPIALVLGWLLFSATTLSAPLTTLRVISALNNAEASHHLPVSFQGVVTYFSRSAKGLDVQDGDKAIYVRGLPDPGVSIGDWVLVQGVTQRGVQPVVDADRITFLRHGKLPEPVPATFSDLLGAKLNCRWVKVRGVVGAVDVEPSAKGTHGLLELLMDGGWAQVSMVSSQTAMLNNLLDAEVEVTGAAARQLDSRLQQIGVKIKISSPAEIKILKAAKRDPWKLPTTPMGKIITAYQVRDLSHRVRVHGTITYYRPGSAVVLQNGTKSLWISTSTIRPLRVGDVADAIGFPDTQDNQLILRHAEVRDEHVQAPVWPQLATWKQLAFWPRHVGGGYEYDLVSTEGKVLAEMREATQDEYILSSGGRLFTALYTHRRGERDLPPMLRVPVGSTIRVTGICLLTVASPVNGEAPFDILLRSFHDIAIIAQPAMVNVHDLTMLAALLFCVVILVVARSLVLERKMRRETAALAYLERRRSLILENMNSGRPLAEIIEQITEMVSFKLRGAPCWCEVSDGARLGNRPEKLTTQRIVHEEIRGRAGATHGTLFAAMDGLARPVSDERTALMLGAELATLAIETSQLYNDLVHRSEYDLLTDVQNRFSLEKSMDRQIQAARQSAGVFGLIYIDLDGFKQVNDQYGHQVGDLYLQEVALRMQRQLRPGDTLARLGGDEFAVLVGGVRNRSDVEEIAQRLERCFDDAFTTENCVVNGAASVGLAMYPEDGATRDALLSFADTAMYRAKNAERKGKNGPGKRTEPDVGG